MIDSKSEYIIMILGFLYAFYIFDERLFYFQVNIRMKEFFKSVPEQTNTLLPSSIKLPLDRLRGDGFDLKGRVTLI